MAWANQGLLMYTVTAFAYFGVPFYLLIRGCRFRAGLSMAMISIISLWYFLTHLAISGGPPSSDSGRDFGLVVVGLLMSVLPMLLMLWGAVAAIVRGVRRWRPRTP